MVWKKWIPNARFGGRLDSLELSINSTQMELAYIDVQ